MIIIIGASGGIGGYLASEYSKKGERVVGTYLNTPSVSFAGCEHEMIKVDSRDSAAVESFVESVIQDDDYITLINCLGINYNAFGHKAAISDWRDVIETNLIGTFNSIRAVLPAMRAKGYGRIINFSSVVPQIGVAGTTAYSASKSGLWGLVKALSAENAAKNISINNINLGYFNIGMIKDVPDVILQEIKERIPAKRLGDDHEIFEVVEMLRNVGYINGSSIDMNGGL